MNQHTFRAAALVLSATALLAAPAAHAAPAPSSSFQGVLGSCGDGDDLVADFTTREAGKSFADGRATVHLQLTGTVTRTGTGVVGHYAERQNDVFGADGSQQYTGVLSQLVVRGAKGYTWSGHASFPADGEPQLTHGLAPLMDADFAQVLCHALR